MMQKTRVLTALNNDVLESPLVMATFRVHDYDEMTCQIEVETNALDQFIVSGRVHDESGWMILFNAGADFTSPAGLMIDASGDLTAQAVGAGWFKMNVGGFYELRISAASGNAAGSVLSVYAGFR